MHATHTHTHTADKLLNLDQALVQLRPVQSRWKELADALRVPETYIQQVDDKCGKDHASSMTEIIDYWMRSCGGRPTWRELADALKRVKEDSLAQQLMSIYNTGEWVVVTMAASVIINYIVFALGCCGYN